MQPKYLFQTIVLLVVLFSAVGGAESVQAEPGFQDGTPEIVVREMTFWNATYSGYVDFSRYEKWPFVLDDTYDFSITVNTTSGDLAPLVILMDESGTELATSIGMVTSTQPAGSYFVQIQPEAGSGNYDLMIRQEDFQEPEPLNPSVSTVLSSEEVTVGDSATASVNLDNVPAEGYASAEFTCTYPADLIQVSNIAATDLFGADPAVAVFDQQDGLFIVAIAGSNGQRAATSGTAFTFDTLAVGVGQAMIECTGRVSYGDDGLTEIPSTAVTQTINDVVVDGTLTGQVTASKAVAVSLYDSASTLITSTVADVDGTFSLTAPAGTYTVVATASGFLSAQGSAVITAGETSTKPAVSLVAGDIDGNSVIDQYDAMTIGMSYNTATPDAADLNADGTINVLDLEILAANYRATGPLGWE